MKGTTTVTNPFGSTNQGNPGDNSSSNPYGSNPYGTNAGDSQQAGQGYNQFGQPAGEQGAQAGYGQQGNGQPYGGQQGYGQQQAGGYQAYPNQGYANQAYPNQGYANQGYTQQQPGTFDAMQSIGQAWKIFVENPVAWIVGLLAYMVVSYGIFFVGFLPMIMFSVQVQSDPTAQPPAMGMGMMFICIVLFVLMMGLTVLVSYRVAAKAIAGEGISIGDFFNFKGLGLGFGVFVAFMVLYYIGSLLIVGGLVVAFLFSFATIAAVAKPELGFIGAFKSSFTVSTTNFVQVLVFGIMAFLISLAGTLALGVGSLVAIPVIYIAVTHAYLTAVGGNIRTRA